MASLRFFTPTVVVLAVAFAAAPWLFLALPPWAASLAWAVIAAVAAFTYLGERRRWRRDLEVEELDRQRGLDEARARESALAQRLAHLEARGAVAGPSAVSEGAAERVAIRFREAAALAGFSLVDSQSFTEGEVHELLTAFESLGRLSMEMETTATQAFASLLDPSSSESLASVVTESEAIASRLGEFFARLNHLYEKTRGSVKTNAEELGRVKDMANTIEEFFENIRMISLNLSIEASRIGAAAGGKALQVLAQRLRDFSNRAQELSGLQRTVVTVAEAAITASQAELTTGFVEIEAQVRPIREQIETFPTIIGRAHSQFDTVMFGLTQLTAAVQMVLKERLGKLQFQDLTRQEHEHLAALLTHFAALAPVPQDPALAGEERLSLARDFNDRATTANERRVLLAWLDRHGLSRDLLTVKGDDHESGKVMLF
jgi:hypothetical protein